MVDVLILQGTTPSYEFEFEDEDKKLVVANMIEKMTAVFHQEKTNYEIKKLYTKDASKNSITFEGNVAVVSLTQEETFGFTPGFDVEIQMKILLTTGEILMSDMYRGRVEASLDKEVLSK